MAHLKAILLILIGLVIIILAIQNNETMSGTVQLRVNPFVFAERRSGDISLYQVVLVTFLLGVLKMTFFPTGMGKDSTRAQGKSSHWWHP